MSDTENKNADNLSDNLDDNLNESDNESEIGEQNISYDLEDVGKITPDENDSEDDLEENKKEDEDDEIDEELDDDDKQTIKDNKNKKKDDFIVNDLEDDEEEDYDDDDDDEEEDENYFKKLDENVKKNVILDYHPEIIQHNYEEIEALSRVVRNEQGLIIDPLHRTLPFITKYEKARILGDRARQINSGAKPFVKVEPFIIDGYLIALKEFEEKKIPFIIKRPMPNGGTEYWKLKDLEILI